MKMEILTSKEKYRTGTEYIYELKENVGKFLKKEWRSS